MTRSQIETLAQITQGALCSTLPDVNGGLVYVAPLGEFGGRLYEIGKKGGIHVSKFHPNAYFLGSQTLGNKRAR